MEITTTTTTNTESDNTLQKDNSGAIPIDTTIKNKLQISIDYHILNLLDLHFSNLEKIYKCNINFITDKF